MEIPSSTRERRLVFAVVLLACVLILVVRYFAIPAVADTPRPTLSSFADAVLSDAFAAILAGALIGAALVWLLPKSRVRAEIETVAADERGAVLERARADTTEYWFSGATGRFTRAVTLPELARKAKSKNIRKAVNILILDPVQEAGCLTYVAYRNRVRSGRRQTTGR